jgi:hypothetical protein
MSVTPAVPIVDKSQGGLMSMRSSLFQRGERHGKYIDCRPHSAGRGRRCRRRRM